MWIGYQLKLQNFSVNELKCSFHLVGNTVGGNQAITNRQTFQCKYINNSVQTRFIIKLVNLIKLLIFIDNYSVDYSRIRIYIPSRLWS